MNEWLMNYVWPILLRDGLKIAGGALVSHGLVTNEAWVQISAGIIMIVGAVVKGLMNGATVSGVVGKVEGVPDVVGIQVTSSALANKLGDKVQAVVGGGGFQPEGPGGTEGAI